jgi:hypothetical protein
LTPDPLYCQGGVQINVQIKTGTGTESVSADLPNGPKPGTVWAVDACGMLFFDSNPETYPAPICGIYMVPIGTPIPEETDTNTTINIASRGLPIALNNQSNVSLGFGLAGGASGQISYQGPSFIVPAGYTLRAILSCGTGANFTGNITLKLFAQLRILKQNEG